MKGSPTCSCVDCVKNKQSAVKVTSSVVNSKAKCGEKASHIDLSTLVREDKHQHSLSPCQSCVSAQVTYGSQLARCPKYRNSGIHAGIVREFLP